MKKITVAIVLFAFCCCSIAQKKVLKTSLDHGNEINEDYLAELKKELVLTWPKNRTLNIVFHGHSVPSGYFRTPAVEKFKSYPHLVVTKIKKQYTTAVVNSITTSIGGEQAEQGAKRFKKDVLSLKPDLLFIDYALNDRGIGLERAEKAWRSMIKNALKAKVKLVLLTPTPDLKEDILDENAPLAGYANMIKQLGEEFEVPVVDVYQEFKILKRNRIDLARYMAQNNHPNQLGHEVAANAIVKSLFGENFVQQKPNIILIVTDDQGYADLSAYDHASPKCQTPNMDRLAENGVLFDNCYVSGPVCSPSRAAMYTGMYQERWDAAMNWRPALPTNVPTLAEILKENGYVTGRVGKSDYGKNYHNPNAREFPTNHGYDSFVGFSAHAHDFFHLNEEIEKATPDPYGESASLGRIFRDTVKESFYDTYSTDLYTDEAIKFVKANKDKPFFLDLPYNAVHELIHQVPDKYLKKWDVRKIPDYDPSYGTYNQYYWDYTQVGKITDEEKRKLYLANLNCLDDNIGRLLNYLEEENLLENTLIMLISDNGGEPLTGANNLPLSGSKYTMHEGGIRVPFIVSWPKALPQSKLYKHRVSALDIVPTCLQAADISIDNFNRFDGVSLLKPIQNNAPSIKTQEPLCFKFGKQWAIIHEGWKLVLATDYNPKHRPITSQIMLGANSGKVALYNLKTDVGERINLIDEEPEKAKELQSKFNVWLKQMKADHKNYHLWNPER